jgi:hypothetical protein
VRCQVIGYVDSIGAWALIQHGGLFEFLGHDGDPAN